jgi:hypothetical protein
MRGGGGAGGRIAPSIDEHTALIVFAGLLDLSDAQQSELEASFEAAIKTAAPLNTQIDSSKEEFYEAVKAGKTDQQIQTLADKQGTLTSELLDLQAQTFKKMVALLTADQKPKVDGTMFIDIGLFLLNAHEPIVEAPAVAPQNPAAPTTPATAATPATPNTPTSPITTTTAPPASTPTR